MNKPEPQGKRQPECNQLGIEVKSKVLEPAELGTVRHPEGA
jgi:hypothetical protein